MIFLRTISKIFPGLHLFMYSDHDVIMEIFEPETEFMRIKEKTAILQEKIGNLKLLFAIKDPLTSKDEKLDDFKYLSNGLDKLKQERKKSIRFERKYLFSN